MSSLQVVRSVSLGRQLRVMARMIKIEHSVFALPFAYIGIFLAAGGWPGARPFWLLTLAMVAVRSFAMVVNRLVDLPYDRHNPRTMDRPLVTGEIRPWGAVGAIVGCAIVFWGAASALNPLCQALAPWALVWAAGYSLAKRFTWLTHFWLGSVLGLAPLAGWIAFDPVFVPAAGLFFWGVLFWVAGFDILYSCQDTAIDRFMGLHSVPARFGVGPALLLACFAHVVASLFFLMAGWTAGLGSIYFGAWAVVTLLLLGEHLLLAEDDLSRINVAFFTFNGVIAIVLGLGVVVETLL